MLLKTHHHKILLYRSLLCAVFLFFSSIAHALPANFQDKIIFNNLDAPVAISFAPDGKIFIAEKSGVIKVFDDINDTTPTVFANIRNEVFNYGDRGLLGLAVDPQFPTRPYVYALYTIDAPPGGTPPFYNDTCADPDNCPAGSRLVKMTASGNVMSSKQTLLENWCQIENSHSVGMLAFGTDGALYLTHGDGASYNKVDYGQDGGCPDPTNEGGALRSQDLRTPGDPVIYDGALLRLNPDTAAAFPGNPLAGGTITQDDPIISYGFRNPFRYSIDPQTGSIWVADVGWGAWEEIDYIPNPTAAVNDFGWPCYEGPSRQSGYDAANLDICENLYTDGTAKAPYYTYAHTGDSGAITSIALYRGTNFPSTYNGALFFADYTQGWLRVMMPGTNGLPDPTKISDFITGDIHAVDMKVGPDGALYYLDIYTDSVHQITYFKANTPPAAHATATPNNGSLPLLVHFDASTSSDPDENDTISYEWDLDGDGAFDDSTSVAPTFNYTNAQTIPVKLRVTDNHGATSIDTINVFAGNNAPAATINTPVASDTYMVGDQISFSGDATDPDITGSLPSSAFSWEILLFHCAINDPNECHTHSIQTFTGVKNGVFTAPDHEYPSRIQINLTVTDTANSALKTTTSVTIQPKTTTWNFTSNPTGLKLSIYGAENTTPFSRTVILNAQTNISAPSPQSLGASNYQFASWSDGGAATHAVTVTPGGKTFNAVYNFTGSTAIWHSWEVTTQAGSPQGIVVSNTNVTAQMEFYESTNNLGVAKGSLFSFYDPNQHQQAFNHVASYWSGVGGADAYPYVGKSIVGRGSDGSETNAKAPLGVFDLQLHPPGGTDHNTIAAFKVPQNGNYVISDLGVRRVFNSGNNARLHVYNAQGAELTNLTATNNEQWVTTNTTYTLSNLTAGQYIYFGVDRVGDYSWDATEISWTITADFSGSAPQPTCTLSANPTSIAPGGNTALSWTTNNATGFSIDQGIGAQSSVGSGSINQSPTTTTTYTGTATGAGGSGTCTATVTVNGGGSGSFPVTILGKDFATKTTGGVTGNGDGGWNIWSNGSISTPINFTQTGQYKVTIDAAGELAGNALPHMEFRLDGVLIGSADVGNTSYSPFNFNINIASAGSHQLEIAFTNDFYANPADRNLIIHDMTVAVGSQQNPPTCTLSANPASINSGSSSSLSWTTTNATSISINQGIGNVTPVASGSKSVSPTATTTYTATVTGPGGTNQCTATLTVTGGGGGFPVTVLGKDFATKTTGGPTWNGDGGWIIWSNGNISTPINFTQTGQYKVTINALGELAGTALPHMEFRLDGTLIGSADVGNTTYAPFNFNINVTSVGSHQLSIAFTNDFLSGNNDRNLDVHDMTVAVGSQQQNPPTCTLGANPTSIASGNSSTLSWTTANATSISINQGVGTVTPVAGGSKSVSPTTTTTYTATVTGAGGTGSCSATVTVTSNPQPTCTLSVNPTSIAQGGSSTLSWTTANATSLTIDHSVGSVTPVAGGSKSVAPTSTTTYTGTVNGAGGTNSCTTTLTVTTGSGFPKTVLGGDFATKSTGGPTWNHDGGWIIWSNGNISTPINFTQTGQYKVTINALGELAGSALPHMEFRLDGVLIGSADVGNTSYAPFNFNINITSAGNHQLSIAFTNDFYSSPNDRNLDIHDMTVAVGP